MAPKKAGGSARNGRDTAGRARGVSKCGGEKKEPAMQCGSGKCGGSK